MEVEMPEVSTVVTRQEVFGNTENNLPRRPHQCVTCSKSFSAPSKLRRHILSHTGQRPFGCHFCEKAYRQLAHLKLHINSHFAQRPLRRINTGSDSHRIDPEKVFPKRTEACLPGDSSNGLNVEDTFATTSVSPTACYNSMPDSTLGSSHVSQHNLPIVPSLHPEMESFGSLPIHVEPVNGQDSNVSCKHTVDEDTSGPDETVVKDVQKSNCPRTVHQCPECFKCFSAPSKLKRHCLIHTGQRPFHCTICCSSFRQLSHLKAHSTVHSVFAKKRSPSQPKRKSFAQPQRSQTWPRNYVCNMCGKKYRQMRHLIVHQQTHKVPEISLHPVKQKDRCIPYPLAQGDTASQVPSDSQNSESSAILNMDANETQQLSDQTQKDDSPGDCASEKHQNTTRHNRKENSEKRQTSSLTKKVKVNQCMVCQKTFEYPSKLSRHLLVHMGIKPFRCQVCSKSFRQLCHLHNHQKIHTLKSGLNLTKQVKNKPASQMKRKKNQQSDSEPLKTNTDLKHDSDQRSTEGLYSHATKIPAWSYNGNMLPGLDCSTVDTHFSGELVSQRPVQNTDYRNSSQAFDARPAHEMPKRRKLASQNKPVLGRGQGYCCPVCSKHFSAPSKLRRHSLTHVGQRSFQCPVCFKTFKQSAHLQTHMAFHNEGDEAEFSPGLSEERETEPLLSQEEYHCPTDVKYSISPLKDKETEPVCEQSSSNGKDLLATDPATSTGHATISSPENKSVKSTSQSRSRGYQCALCLKKFEYPSKLSRHLLIHMGIKPFRCQVCSKSFRQLCHLQNHQKVHNRSSWHEGQPNEADMSLLAQQDQRSSNEDSVPERHVDYPTAPHQDEAGTDETYGDQQRNCPHYEQSVDESYPQYCPSGPSNLDNLNLSFDYDSTLHPKAEDANHIKSESNCRPDQKCISTSKSDKSTWHMAEEKHAEIPSDEYNEQEHHTQFQTPYFSQQETAHNEHMHPIPSHHAPLVNDHSLAESHEIPHDSDHKLYLYQSTMTPPYCHTDYGVKEERMEVRLRSEVNLAYMSDPPKDLHVCPGCSQCFTTKRKLSLHKCDQKPSEKERHSSSYQCAICYKSFEAPSKLKRHYLIHTGQRPFQCSVCEKAFTQSGHLKTHLQTHK
ncbi:zinc finger protein 770-like [Osmerus mordax]|uniref:zinc finger protein 770-like n=1 Tax=Osmerus mordax TaxID=8014 RepID=UPI00350F1A0E